MWASQCRGDRATAACVCALLQVSLPALRDPKLLWQSFLHPFPVQLLRVHIVVNEETGHAAESLWGESSPDWCCQIKIQVIWKQECFVFSMNSTQQMMTLCTWWKDVLGVLSLSSPTVCSLHLPRPSSPSLLLNLCKDTDFVFLCRPYRTMREWSRFWVWSWPSVTSWMVVIEPGAKLMASPSTFCPNWKMSRAAWVKRERSWNKMQQNLLKCCFLQLAPYSLV